ncbi:Dystrotelin [Dissostichus eleginoides]|uniref:Dystrotelin n=1 Tax=Dissostichus eleginoides TaxID=100907 RepID=A0AAD9ES47_DISEL|nr:Dystrotelin [Dissostichus eleginoides]
MFRSVGQEVLGHVTLEETCSMMFGINDRSGSGFISSASLQTSLIALSAETLHRKYTALIGVAVQRGSASISRSGLRALLQDLSQVPAALQEDGAFGQVEAAVSSCFEGVRTGSRQLIGGRHGDTASGEHVLSWLRGEPPLLLWLPTLHRLSVSQDVRHDVRCHTCKTRPFTGLRYRSRSARYTLLPRRQTQREAGRRRGLEWAEPQDSAPPPSEDSVSQNASVHPPTSSKALQTEEEPTQSETCRETNEQGVLEDRCSEMEVTMATLRENNLHLQCKLTQAVTNMETQQHANNTENMQTRATTENTLTPDNMLNMENTLTRGTTENTLTPDNMLNMDNTLTRGTTENTLTPDNMLNMENTLTRGTMENTLTPDNMLNMDNTLTWGNTENTLTPDNMLNMENTLTRGTTENTLTPDNMLNMENTLTRATTENTLTPDNMLNMENTLTRGTTENKLTPDNMLNMENTLTRGTTENTLTPDNMLNMDNTLTRGTTRTR